MLVYLNVQVTSFPENPTPRDYTGLHEIEKQSLSQFQLLFDPDYCCPVVFQYSEGDYPPCQST